MTKPGDNDNVKRKNRMRPYAKPKLNQSEWNLLDRTLDNEIETTDQYLDSETKWLYKSQKGTSVFAIYGIGDGTEATPLYASGGEKALRDYKSFQQFLEGGNETKRSTATLDRLLKKYITEKGNTSSRVPNASNGRSDVGDVPISIKERGSDIGGDSGRGLSDRRGRGVSPSNAADLAEVNTDTDANPSDGLAFSDGVKGFQPLRNPTKQTSKRQQLMNRMLADQDFAWQVYHKAESRAQARSAADHVREIRQAERARAQENSADMRAIHKAEMALQREAANALRLEGLARQSKLSKMEMQNRLRQRAAQAALRTQQQAAKSRKESAPTVKQDLTGQVFYNTPAERQFQAKMQDAISQLRTVGRAAYRTFVSEAEALERFSHHQENSGLRADTLTNITKSSTETVSYIYQDGLVDRQGNPLMDNDGNPLGSLQNVVLCYDENGKISRTRQSIFNDYLYYLHTVDRMSLKSRTLQRVTAFEQAHPELEALSNKAIAELASLSEEEAAAREQTELQQTALLYLQLLDAYNRAEDKPVMAITLADGSRQAVTAETAAEKASEMESAHPWLKKKAEKLYAWNDAFMRAWGVGTSFTEESYDLFRELYPHYVPTYRLTEDGEQRKRGGGIRTDRNGMTVGRSTQAATGSLLPLGNVEDNFARKVNQVVRNARNNQLFTNVILTLMLDDGSLAEEFGAFNWDALRNGVEYTDMDGNPANAEDANPGSGDDTNTMDDGSIRKNNDGSYTIRAWFNGELLSANVSKEMYDALLTVTGKKDHSWVDTAAKIGNLATMPMKAAITGYNPFFALRNVARDIPTAVVNSSSGLAFPKYLGQAIADIYAAGVLDHQTLTALVQKLGVDITKLQGNAARWEQFKALGGTHSGYYNNNNSFVGNMESGDGKWNQVKQAAGALNEVTESMTRFAEYLATIDRMGDTPENRLLGIKNSAEVTVDFSRHGSAGKLINAWIPYWNPGVQGIDKTVRSVIQSPDGSAIWKQALKTVGRASIPSVLFNAILFALLKATGKDKEYEQLSDRVKGSYYCIPKSWLIPGAEDEAFIKIPKQREWGAILGYPFMALLETADGRPDAFKNWLEVSLAPEFLPNGPFDAIGLSQAYHLATNKDFAGRRIVSYDLESKSPAQQYTSDTSVLTRGLGQLFNFSPVQADYLISDYFGDFGKLFIAATSESTWNGEDSFWDKARNIISSPFEADNRYSNQSLSDYYDLLDKLEQKAADDNNAETSPWVQEKKAVNTMYGKDISALAKKVNELPDGEEKDATKKQITELAKDALAYADMIESGTIKNPELSATYEKMGIAPKVSSELVRLHPYSDEVSFEPSVSVSKTYTDPNNKGNAYVLTDDQKGYFRELYAGVYNEIVGERMRYGAYQDAQPKKRAEMLAEWRKDVLEETKDRFFAWLRSNGVKSQPKN